LNFIIINSDIDKTPRIQSSFKVVLIVSIELAPPVLGVKAPDIFRRPVVLSLFALLLVTPRWSLNFDYHAGRPNTQ